MSLASKSPLAVVNWRLDEASGVAFDAIGTSQLSDHNTVGSATGKLFNLARQFVRANEEGLVVADNADLSGGDIPWMIRLWAKVASYPTVTGSAVLVYKWDSSDGGCEWGIGMLADGTVFFVVSTTGNDIDAVFVGGGGDPIALDTWTLIHAWHDPTNNKIYISLNDSEPLETAFSTGIFDGDAPVSVGWNSTNTFQYFDGQLQDVIILKGGYLDAGERTADYNGGAGIPWHEWITEGSGEARAVATSQGTGYAAAIGSGSATANADAPGTGYALAIGAGTADAEATAVGQGYTAAVGSGVATAEATAVGVGVVVEDAVGSGTAAAEATALGTGYSAAIGSGSANAVADALGSGYASAVGYGSADAEASATGEGSATDDAIGSGVAAAEASAVGAGYAAAIGSGQAASEADSIAVGYTLPMGAGDAQAVAAATGVGYAIAAGSGVATAVATAVGAAADEAATLQVLICEDSDIFDPSACYDRSTVDIFTAVEDGQVFTGDEAGELQPLEYRPIP